MNQGIDSVTGCPIVFPTRNKKQRNFLASQKKKKEATGLKYKAQRLQKAPEKARHFKHIKHLLKKSEKLTAQLMFIPLFH
jgi:5,10-methylene-tetrahydrofolate dehydrogenase/methenyl tetrahydrofolate cyclohydrolase